jgi:hypothetical protein
MDFLNPVRSYDEILLKAVRLVLERHPDFTTSRELPIFPYNDFYLICARRYNEMLVGLQAKYDNIEFTEYSDKTEHAPGSVFHTFKCEQYLRNSMEDQQQIQNLAKLIFQFCRERLLKQKSLSEYNYFDYCT